MFNKLCSHGKPQAVPHNGRVERGGGGGGARGGHTGSHRQSLHWSVGGVEGGWGGVTLQTRQSFKLGAPRQPCGKVSASSVRDQKFDPHAKSYR